MYYQIEHICITYLYKLYMNAIKIRKCCPGLYVKTKLLLKIATIIYSLHQSAYQLSDLSFLIFNGQSTAMICLILESRINFNREIKLMYLTESCIILAINIRAFIIIGSVIGPFCTLNPSMTVLQTSTLTLSL